MAVGYFDGMHLGHQQVVRRALSYREQGLKTCVFSFTTRSSAPTDGKAKHKIVNLRDKIHLCREMGVDYLIAPEFEEFRGKSPEQFVREVLRERLNGRIVCCGYDFRYGKGAAGNTATLTGECAKLGMAVEIVEAVTLEGEPISSTRIRRAMAEGDIGLVNRMLGRPYSYTYPVVHGRQLGRRLGFPTINQHFEEGRAIPKYGVYASRAVVDGQVYPAVTNIGVKPTVGADGPVSETYIIGVDRDLYGQEINVSLVAFLRGETRFDGVEALQEQIRRDAARSEMLLRAKV